MPVITARVPEAILKDVEKFEDFEKSDRAEAVRKLLAKALKEWKLEQALALLREHKITYRKAAALAGVTYGEILRLAEQADIDIGYTLEELRRDIRR
jgi:predicted HTH domain antitoxin